MNLTVHLSLSHSMVSVLLPLHVAPPLGTGDVHNRILLCLPIPQMDEHSDQFDQTDHPPDSETKQGHGQKSWL